MKRGGGSRAGARFGLVVAWAAAAVGCAGPPWSMGRPLNGSVSIPETTASPAIKRWKAQAKTEGKAGHTLFELRALLAIDDAERLDGEEATRLVALLGRRATELLAMSRAIPASADLREIERLAPERALALRPQRAEAERAAGDVWFSVGDLNQARDAFARAQALGAAGMDIRLAALNGGGPPPGMSPGALEEAITELPLRAVPPFAHAYVTRGGADPAVLARALLAARQERQAALADRIQDALSLVQPKPAGDSQVVPAVVSAPETAPAAPAAAGGGAAKTEASLVTSEAERPPPAPLRPPPPEVSVPPDIDEVVLASAALSFRLIPLLRAAPELLAPSPRSRRWAELLLEEDPTSPEVLELTALIDGWAGRSGGAGQKIADLIYFTPDRYQGMVRGAAIWERIGQSRQACALWLRAARWRDEVDDPAWRRAVACTRRDPAAGDWRAIRQYVLERAPDGRRADIAAGLDAP